MKYDPTICYLQESYFRGCEMPQLVKCKLEAWAQIPSNHGKSWMQWSEVSKLSSGEAGTGGSWELISQSVWLNLGTPKVQWETLRQSKWNRKDGSTKKPWRFSMCVFKAADFKHKQAPSNRKEGRETHISVFKLLPARQTQRKYEWGWQEPRC